MGKFHLSSKDGQIEAPNGGTEQTSTAVADFDNDGKGNFPREIIVSNGIDIHESEMADLDGDGDLDILGKAYNGDTPRLDIWL